MNRRHRRNFNEPGHAHELTFSCYGRHPFLKSARVCQWLADAIDAARTKHRFNLWAFVFMPDHAHLIVCPKDSQYDIAAIRKGIKASVGAKGIAHIQKNSPDWLPRITRQRGGKSERLFWQSGGGYDRNITEPATLLKMIGYLHLNPVRKGFVEHVRDWEWSSAAEYEGLSKSKSLGIDPIPSDWSG